jgi:hypothetical protein
MLFRSSKKEKMESTRTRRLPRRIIKGTGPKNRPPRLWPPEKNPHDGNLLTNVERASSSLP